MRGEAVEEQGAELVQRDRGAGEPAVGPPRGEDLLDPLVQAQRPARQHHDRLVGVLLEDVRGVALGDDVLHQLDAGGGVHQVVGVAGLVVEALGDGTPALPQRGQRRSALLGHQHAQFREGPHGAAHAVALLGGELLGELVGVGPLTGLRQEVEQIGVTSIQRRCPGIPMRNPS